MNADVQGTTRQASAERKRAAILDAAQALFLADGYERTSVDAIAAQAEVSKRTVYDYFGDKLTVFSAVLSRVSSKLPEAVRDALAREVPAGCLPYPGLLAFARSVATVTFASSEYVLYRRLLAAAPPSAIAPTSEEDPIDLLVARMAEFIASGDLSGTNPQRVAEHFVALTFLVALDALHQPPAADAIDEILVDGVDAFIRAYRPHTPGSAG